SRSPATARSGSATAEARSESRRRRGALRSRKAGLGFAWRPDGAAARTRARPRRARATGRRKGLSDVNRAGLEAAGPMTLDQIAAIVRDVLADDSIEVGFDSRPRDIEGWDSLANVSIVFSLEESLGGRLDTNLLVGDETVAGVVRAVD